MKQLLNDPTFWGAVVAILICAAGLYWAINAYRNLGKSSVQDDLPPLDLEQDAPIDLPMPLDEHSEPELTEGLEPALKLEPPAPRPPFELPKPPPPPPPPAAKMPGQVPPSVAAPTLASAPAAAAPSADVVNRLETMNQRLAEMQAVLSKQAATGGTAPTVGQGFSPETIDKLLRIIGNVVMQVEILQRSYAPQGGEASKSSAGAAPASTAR